MLETPNTLFLNSYQLCVTVATWFRGFARQREGLCFDEILCKVERVGKNGLDSKIKCKDKNTERGYMRIFQHR